MMETGHVFISYAVADGSDTARQLHDDLEKQNISVWMDVFNIRDGFDWDAEIDRGLDGARAVVVILTPGSVLSLQVKAEWNDALNRHIPVIPLLAQECSVPRVLRMLNYISLVHDKYENSLDRVISRLENLSDEHLSYLENLLEEFIQAQKASDEPARFQYKIDNLQQVIRNWKRRFQHEMEQISAQKERIENELAEQKLRHLTETQNLGISQKTVAGQRLTDIGTRFFDRNNERLELSRLLFNGQTKLVSVIGRGGIGKSGLVSKILADLENGVWAHAPDDDTPVNGIAYLSTRTRGISVERIYHDCLQWFDADTQSKLISIWTNSKFELKDRLLELLSMLSQGIYVLLLDNMEDLLDEQSTIIDPLLTTFFEVALRTPTALRIVVTSRRPVSLPRELTSFDNRIFLENGLPTEDAVEFLRSLDPNAEFGIRNASDDELILLSNSVHGVPRALEIIASILANDPFLTPNELTQKDELFSQKEFIEDLVKENYRTVSVHERRILETLAVFGRPVPQVAIEFVLSDDLKGINVPQLIRRLAHTHTIDIDRQNKTLFMHPIDRDFIYALINERPTNDDYSRNILETKAAAYYRSIHLPQENWTNIHSIESHIFQFEHLVRAENFSEACDIIELIDYDYLILWGYTERVIDMRTRLIGKLTAVEKQAMNLNGLGYAYYVAGEYQNVVSFCEEARDLSKNHGFDKIESRALANLGRAYRYLGDYEGAIDAHMQAVELAQKAGDIREEGVHWGNLGRISDSLAKFNEAISYYNKGLEIALSIDDKRGASYRIGYTGYALLLMGQIDQAQTKFQDAIKLTQEIKYKRGENIHTNNYAGLHIELGNYEQAEDLCNMALDIAQDINHVSSQATITVNLGRIWLQSAQYTRALTAVNDAVKLVADTDDPRIMNVLYTFIARVYMHLGDFSQSKQAIQTALEYDNPQNNFHTNTIALLVFHDDMSQLPQQLEVAYEAIDRILDLTPSLYMPKYYRSLCYCFDYDKTWEDVESSLYSALQNFSGHGTLKDFLLLVESIQLKDNEKHQKLLDAIRQKASTT